MPALTEFVPQWISILFLSVIWIPIYLIASLAKKGAEKSGAFDRPGKVKSGILIFYLFYLLYVSIASINGLFDENILPPKILIYSMFPLVTFLMLVVYNRKSTQTILKHLELSELVRLHIFRLIGSFFLILFLFHALPRPLGLIAGLGDIITAISSLFVARAISRKKVMPHRLVFIWNTFGLLDIVATSATALILTKIALDTGVQGVESLAEFPFCFIPAFAPATIIFLHMSIYRKLSWLKKPST